MKKQTLESTNMDVVELDSRNSGNEVIERFQVEKSPFTIISVNGEHFGVMGEYRMTESYESRGACEKELKQITWNRIIQVMMVLEEIRSKDENFNKTIKKALKTEKN